MMSARPGCPPSRARTQLDRKSTRLNSSHGYISYADFCLKTISTDYGAKGGSFTCASYEMDAPSAKAAGSSATARRIVDRVHRADTRVLAAGYDRVIRVLE